MAPRTDEHMQRQISVVDCSCSNLVFAFQSPVSHDITEGDYIVTSLRLPQPDVFGGQTNDISVIIHNAGSRAASPHIDANVMAGIWVELIARIS
jgi:hypothetical protein